MYGNKATSGRSGRAANTLGRASSVQKGEGGRGGRGGRRRRQRTALARAAGARHWATARRVLTSDTAGDGFRAMSDGWRA